MPLTTDDGALGALLGAHFAGHRPAALGLAVSGGGDSMALLHLAAQWARAQGIRVEAATVDHGLRPEAADEARLVAGACAALGLRHQTLGWQGWDGQGNLQAEARAARYRLLAGWGRARGLDRILLGHTMDDQAETFLLRLARKSGVDGLAAMRAVFDRDGQGFGRPLLAARRRELRDYLDRRGLSWCEDPSNQDPRFDRVRMRRALEVLAPLGIDAPALAATGGHLGAARAALDHLARITAHRICRIEHGDVLIDRAGLGAAPQDSRHRLLGAALIWVSGAPHAPRSAALSRLWQAIEDGQDMTLAGCLVAVTARELRVMREFNAVRELRAAAPQWDRWQVAGPWQAGHEMRALGAEALAGIADWRA
ncbi:tRNA lysidine(34) synthetase TilS, partial [Shimia sp.]|uniref:tRNA lysidine(34) synthetase TilS n=1 Tax=Shimia sp. TaxID=1954381 RepID=UPI003562F1F4